jgi:putative protease
LLAPARDLECGLAAIDCGADAVYVGATRFGARARAANPVADVEALARHAHTYWARVYVTLNTLLRDDELPEAVRLAHRLYDAGVDGLIVQDLGLLECDLPPLPLIASTQLHNHTPERVAFLERVGFRRAILARELSLEEIHAIRQATTIELECFVHGALCVCYSGQCYLSHAIGGRSGNRGECAQPCRRKYSLVDGSGATLVANRYLLSLKDLNLSEHLADLTDAGVTSFKIEGRLKDRAYVANVVSAYRRALDQVLVSGNLSRSSSGESRVEFTPDLRKTYNRGYTTHFLHGRVESPGSIETPKMVGEPVGRVVAVRDRSFDLEPDAVELHSGDGICFFDRARSLRGTLVNGVRGSLVRVNDVEGMEEGTLIYRNHDRVFLSGLEKGRVERTIGVWLELANAPEGLLLTAVDEDGNEAAAEWVGEGTVAEKPERALANARKQLCKMGGTPFACLGLEVACPEVPFVPLSELNGLRRDVLAGLEDVRERNRPVLEQTISPNDAPFPAARLTYLGNVLNRKAAAFYRRHGVGDIEPAAESGLDMRGRRVMRSRYCIRHQLGLCPGRGGAGVEEPLALVDEEGRRLDLRFDCAACEMEVLLRTNRQKRRA